MQSHAHVADDSARTAVRTRTEQIVLIEDAQGVGTGILVGADGLVLTNKHVAPGLGPYRVILADGKDVRGVGVHQSPHHDLAIVKIAASPQGFLDVTADVVDEYVVGEEVFALGHPRGCRFSVARGIISNPHREMEKEYYVQTDVSINPGNSGGPLVDRRGALVGIVTMMLSNSQGLGFAVPGHVAADYVRHVRRLLRAMVVRVPEDLLAHPEAQREGASEIVRRAVNALALAGRGSIEEEKPEEGTYRLKHKGAVIAITLADGLFSVVTKVTPLGPSERQNAAFLGRMLELSGSQDLGGATLSIRDGALFAGIARRAAGLDLDEATWAIDTVTQMGTDAPPKVAAILFSTQPQGSLSAVAKAGAPPGSAPTTPQSQGVPPAHTVPQTPMMPGAPMMPAPNMAPPVVPGTPPSGPMAVPQMPHPQMAPSPYYTVPAPGTAPAPAAGAGDAASGDPGYPILQMPPDTGWK